MTTPPDRKDRPASWNWLRFKIGTWMQEKGQDLEHRALYPNDKQCPECGCWVSPGYPCDHIPF